MRDPIFSARERAEVISRLDYNKKSDYMIWYKAKRKVQTLVDYHDKYGEKLKELLRSTPQSRESSKCTPSASSEQSSR